MKKLLEMAKNVADSVEILCWNTHTTPVSFQDRRFDGITFTDSSNIALRLIKDGKLGTSYGDSLEKRDTLINQALKSASYGDEAEFDFSDLPILPLNFENYDEDLLDLPLEKMASETLELIDFFKSNGVDGTVRASASVSSIEVRFLNSKNVEGSAKISRFTRGGMLVLPESGVGPMGHATSYTYTQLPEKKKERMLADYHNGLTRVPVPTRKMKLLVTPFSWFMLKWRIERAVSAQSLCERISPLEGKEGQQVLDERITIIDHPHRKGYHNTDLFDDEGVPTKPYTLFDRGVFNGFICDLKHAKKLGRQPTGHGWKTSMWGGGVETPVQPALQHLMIEPGDATVEEMIQGMDEGVIVHFPNSAHSGNIPQGDFSVNIGLGYYVKDGKVQGRVEDCMVSGNIYALFKSLNTISSEREDESIPWLLFDDVSVAGSS